MGRNISISNSATTKNNGGSCLILFAILWMLFSCVLLFFVGRAFLNNRQIRTQSVQIPCTITKLKIADFKDKKAAFRPDVSFNYKWNNKKKNSNQLWHLNQGSTEYETLYTAIKTIRDRDQNWCYVDPNTGKATLLQKKLSWLVLLIGPLILTMGIALLVAGIKQKRNGKKSNAISSGGDDTSIRFVGVMFFLIFALVGLGLGTKMWSGALKNLEVRNWVETDAEVIWSRLRTDEESDSTTYTVDIFYKYKFNNETFRSNRYDLIASNVTSEAGYEKKQAIVKKYSQGTQFKCFVSPQSPWRAIIKRSYDWDALFLLFPIPFIAIGLGGLIYTFRTRSKNATLHFDGNETRAEQVKSLDRKLRRTHTKEVKGRWASVIFLLIFGLFWNGFVLFFIFGPPSSEGLFVKLFMIPFILIGIAVIFAFCYCVFALFSPHYDLQLADNVETEGTFPGNHVRILWKRKGGIGSAFRLRLWLVGEEEATYTRGTNTVTVSSVFHEELVEDVQSPSAQEGEAKIRIPFDSVPTFLADHNRIQWKLKLWAEVNKRPDSRVEKIIHVLPYTTKDFK